MVDSDAWLYSHACDNYCVLPLRLASAGEWDSSTTVNINPQQESSSPVAIRDASYCKDYNQKVIRADWCFQVQAMLCFSCHAAMLSAGSRSEIIWTQFGMGPE